MNIEVTSVSTEPTITTINEIKETTQYKNALNYAEEMFNSDEGMKQSFIDILDNDALNYLSQNRGDVFVYEILPSFVLSDGHE